MKKYILLLVPVVIILIVALVYAQQNDDNVQMQTRFLMDTYCSITVPGDVTVLDAINSAFFRIEEIEVKFNSLNPESPIFAFNNDNRTIDDPEIVAVIQTALDIGNESGGTLDITVYPLIELWGFTGDSPDVPEPGIITAYLKTVGLEKVAIENGRVVKRDESVKIDLGAIAKGYAIKEALAVLKHQGIVSALINAGGDIYALGTFEGRPWKIGVQNPRGDGVIGVLELTDRAVVTSGDYERYFEKDGTRYHHIIDPRTGYSAEGFASVTVISDDPMIADAWSTALFVMGRERRLERMNAATTFETFIITDDGERLFSSNMQVESVH